MPVQDLRDEERWLEKRKDYAFWRQFNEKPSCILRCPGALA